MAEYGKSLLIDTTKCTGCRACQVACKQWNELAAEDPVPANRGTYENPPDRSHTQWLLVHFKESSRPDGSVAWNFVRSGCRHCIDAPCKQKSEHRDSITIDEQTGAVLFNEGTVNESFARISAACPNNGPRLGPDGRMYKCRMCVERVHAGQLPACAQACPSGAITFGDREEILALAKARVQAAREVYCDAALCGECECRVVILLGDRESMYKMNVETVEA